MTPSTAPRTPADIANALEAAGYNVRDLDGPAVAGLLVVPGAVGAVYAAVWLGRCMWGV